MAKTVIFESEKLEKRQKLMRLLLPLAVLAVIIVIALIIAVIAGKNRAKIHTGGEDTLYPYSWKENRDGTLTFTLPDPKTEGYAWTVTNSVETVAEITKDAKPPKGKTQYDAKPLAAGRTAVTLMLVNSAENSYADRLYALQLVLDVVSEDGKLKTTLHSVGNREMPGVTAGGEAEGWPYQITASGPREITVYLNDKMKEIEGGQEEMIASSLPSGATVEEISTNASNFVMNSWDAVSSDEETVRVNGLQSRDGLVTLWLNVRGEESSSTEITLRSETGGVELVFSVKIAEDGRWTVESHKLNVFEPVIETFEDGGEMVTVTAPESP